MTRKEVKSHEKTREKKNTCQTLWFFLLVHLIFFSGVAQSDFQRALSPSLQLWPWVAPPT